MGVFTDLTYLKLLQGKKLGALWGHLLLQSWWSLGCVSTPVVTTSFSTWKPCINIITMYHYMVWIFLSTFTYQQPFLKHSYQSLQHSFRSLWFCDWPLPRPRGSGHGLPDGVHGSALTGFALRNSWLIWGFMGFPQMGYPNRWMVCKIL